jgi:hypothetical protein
MDRKRCAYKEKQMKKVILLVVLLSFSSYHVAVCRETPTRNFKIVVGVEAKTQDVQLKQFKGFIVTPQGEKLEGLVSVLHKERNVYLNRLSQGQVLSTDHLVLYDEQNRMREIPIENLKSLRITDVDWSGTVGRIDLVASNWSGDSLHLGYGKFIEGRSNPRESKAFLNLWTSNIIYLDTGFDTMTFELFTWADNVNSETFSREKYFHKLGFKELVITERSD